MTQELSPSKPLWRRALGRVATVIVTLAAVGVAAGFVIFGRDVLAERAADVEQPDAAPVVAVAAAPLAVEVGYAAARRFPGQVQAGQRTVMAFEAGGAVAEIMVDEGDRVVAGAPVARLDTRLLRADRDRLIAGRSALEAQAELARRTTERRQALRDRGHASSQALDDVALRLAEVQARIAEIDASIAAIDIRLDKAVLTAPFDADVAERMIDTGAMASPGAPVLSLVEAGVRRFRVGLSPGVVDGLDPGRDHHVRFAGADHVVRLSAVLPELDPATRTRTALFDFVAGDAPPLLETGELTLPTPVAAEGAWAPISALRDGPRGLWLMTTVRRTTEGYFAAVEAVEALHAETDRVYVRGTFRDGDLVVVDGAHRIVPGQEVEPIIGENEAADLLADARDPK